MLNIKASIQTNMMTGLFRCEILKDFWFTFDGVDETTDYVENLAFFKLFEFILQNLENISNA